MHELPLLVNTAMALGAALVGGLIARQVGLPTLVGYLLAGVAIGPFTPGFVGDPRTIGQLAELGVIFLMFAVGLQFSLEDLWRVRRVAIPGAVFQMALATAIGFAIARSWGWAVSASLVLGLALSIASTVVLVRALMDEGELETSVGKLAVGWLVFEDLATVLVLIMLPSFAGQGGGDLGGLALTFLKAGAFVAVMLVVGARVIPWLLLRIAHMQSRELFLLLALTVAVGAALGAAALFGISLALGAFLAGVVVNGSPLSHQVGADLVPFREAFAVLFFVSVGMLVDPGQLLANAGRVAVLTALIVVGKAVLTFAITLLLRQPLRTALVLAAGRGQIGEFSFILGQSALALALLERSQYTLLLAAALLSMTINPLMFALVGPLGRRLANVGWLNRGAAPAADAAAHASLRDHVVVVGYGRVGSQVVDVLREVGVTSLVIESDAERFAALGRAGVPALYGDAANSEILKHVGLPAARTLVVTIPDDTVSGLAVAGARRLSPALPIVARAAAASGVAHLASLGATAVIHPELEGGLEIVRDVLLRLGFPLKDVQRYADVVRRESYRFQEPDDEGHRALRDLLAASRDLQIDWVLLADASPFPGLSLAKADLRARSGASVVAIHRGGEVLSNPGPEVRLRAGDRLGMIGSAEEIAKAATLLGTPLALPDTAEHEGGNAT